MRCVTGAETEATAIWSGPRWLRALGLIAALLHWPIDERAVLRLRLQT